MSGRARIVLGSGSPRRRELLQLAGIDVEVRVADVDESPLAGEVPIAYVARVARSKFEAVAADCGDDQVIVAADTTVDLDGAALGKPVDADDARQMLQRLSGRSHQVHTAVVVGRGDRVVVEVVTTAVTFGELSPDEIDAYLATGEPFDKAGSYAIQGSGGALVLRIDGSPTNVIGLPMRETIELVRAVAGDP